MFWNKWAIKRLSADQAQLLCLNDFSDEWAWHLDVGYPENELESESDDLLRDSSSELDPDKDLGQDLFLGLYLDNQPGPSGDQDLLRPLILGQDLILDLDLLDLIVGLGEKNPQSLILAGAKWMKIHPVRPVNSAFVPHTPVGPTNLPDTINNESKPIDFLDLFLTY